MSDENTTVYILDPDNLPPLTAEEKEMFARLDAMPDEEIDLSDMPEWDFERYPMTRAVPEAKPRRRAAEAEV